MDVMNINELKFKKYPVLDNGFICLVDVMGDDSSIVQAARVSYGNDNVEMNTDTTDFPTKPCNFCGSTSEPQYKGTCNRDCSPVQEGPTWFEKQQAKKDRNLVRYLMSHQHTTPFEMVEIKFMIQAPMDCWRQWIRHRTANVNEYSTRYTEAIDMCQTTAPDQWRLQATDNKQGSSRFLTGSVADTFNTPDECFEHFNRIDFQNSTDPIGQVLTDLEAKHHERSTRLYQQRLACGIAKEQARKDLPLSTYTRAYWKCDLHNIFNFLRLRMDSHAQYEIRSYANAMYEIVKQIVPVACEAFEDYVLNAKKFSDMEVTLLQQVWNTTNPNILSKPEKMTDREWTEFKKKVGIS